MLTFVARRLGLGALVLVAVSFCSWLVFASALNPLSVFFPDFNGPDATAAKIRGHLADPLVYRYWLWLKGMFTGHGFGHTIAYDQPVWPQVGPAFLRTLELMAYALLLLVALSILIGTIAARRRGSAADVGLRTGAYVLGSVPPFLLALLLALGVYTLQFHLHYGLFGGSHAPGFEGWIRNTTLPALAIAVGLAGVHSRYLRSSLLGVLDAQYVTVARAKGASERRVLYRHAMRNALVPFVTVLAFDLGTLFGATLAADYVFGVQGMASVFLNRGLFGADPNILECELILAASVIVVLGVVADLLCAWLDPRLRLA